MVVFSNSNFRTPAMELPNLFRFKIFLSEVLKMYASATILKIINLYDTHGLGSKLK